jgi:hypothetical protein
MVKEERRVPARGRDDKVRRAEGGEGYALTPARSRKRERGRRKEPRWAIPFLRALARTGEARAAAEDAGIDHSTAYARRRAHPEFAGLWRGALVLHQKLKEIEEEKAIAALRLSSGQATRNRPSPGSPAASPTSPAGGRGDEFVVSCGQVKRAGHGRWSKAKEKIFFDELAATANIRRSAAAAGVSYNAVHARRLKHPLFAAKWDAVARSAKASIDMYLIEEAKKTFDPEELELGEAAPRVTIDQAIKISQAGAAKGKPADAHPDPFAEDGAAIDAGGMDAVRNSILGKLARIRAADRKEQLKLGWTLDESFDVMVPPGYVKGPDYRPHPPELPKDYYSSYRMGGSPSPSSE